MARSRGFQTERKSAGPERGRYSRCVSRRRARPSAQLVHDSPLVNFLKRTLHEDHVHPVFELKSDLLEHADPLKAERRVQAD